MGDQTIESLKWAHDLGFAERYPYIQELDGHSVAVSVNSDDGSVGVITLESLAATPYRIREHQKFIDIRSYAAYVGQFRGATVQFGSVSRGNVLAVLDYHADNEPSWATHKAELVSMVTPEWAAFKKSNDKWFSQLEFADFLERWNHVIIEPEAAHISEIALNLEGSVDGVFQAKINRTNGASTFSYEEDVKTNKLTVPSKFKIAVQPFYSSVLTDILILLRFKIEGQRPKFQLVIQNVERIEYEALLEAFKKVEMETGEPVLVGP